jgi:hypothetical protein
LFDSGKCEFRWIPGFSDGFCIFSATWMALETLSFHSSPFFCGFGMEHDNMDWHRSEKFLNFVSGCACEAESLTMSDEERSIWKKMELHPTTCPLFRCKYSVGTACQAIVQFLSKTEQTHIALWEYNDEVKLFCSHVYGAQNSVPRNSFSGSSALFRGDGPVFNILLWNQSCMYTHYDLLLRSTECDVMEGEIGRITALTGT